MGGEIIVSEPYPLNSIHMEIKIGRELGG